MIGSEQLLQILMLITIVFTIKLKVRVKMNVINIIYTLLLSKIFSKGIKIKKAIELSKIKHICYKKCTGGQQVLYLF